MTKIIFFILLFITQNIPNGNNNFKYWESLSEKEKLTYLSDRKLNKIALEYYDNKFRATDDNKTFELLDTITRHNKFLPLYYYLFNKMLAESDGALAEIMNGYCIRIIINNPEYVINHFTLERLNCKKEQYLYQLYGFRIGNEFSYHEENVSDIKYGFPEFKKLLVALIPNVNTENKETLELFFKEIDSTIKNMD